MSRKYVILLFFVLSILHFSLISAVKSDLIIHSEDSLKYYDAQNFTIIGKFHKERNYVRFPQKYNGKLRPEVWESGQNSTGISIRFSSNASVMSIKWTLMSGNTMPHMAPTGIKGVDLYAFQSGVWQFIQTGRPKEKTSEYSMFENDEPVMREYLINLPLYDGLESLSIGVNNNAQISKPIQDYLISNKPVVYYGSSIAQGGCASRPGMAFTNILSRKLDRSFINFGFSGEGTFDASVGEAMCEVDAALYVIDCNPNTGKDSIFERAVMIVRQLKKNKPDVPVLLVENYLYDNSYFTTGKHMDELAKRQELRKAFDELKKSGMTEIYYQGGDGLTGYDHEGTVDGVHPTDLGMQRIADGLLPQLNKILKKRD